MSVPRVGLEPSRPGCHQPLNASCPAPGIGVTSVTAGPRAGWSQSSEAPGDTASVLQAVVIETQDLLADDAKAAPLRWFSCRIALETSLGTS